jgi:tyrosyl-tRNA synthetase
LDSGPLRLYCGFDPTADSLHVGSLQGLAVLRLFAHRGHQPIALVGGATGMIGDPSGKSTERNLLGESELDRNRAALGAQISRLLATAGGMKPLMVDNRDWFATMSAIEFLRDVGKLVPVTTMLERSSVKLRLASEAGLSYTEFSYQLLQAHDFVHLRREFDCELQVGGSDQYGNITAGTDMIRRRGLGRGFGLVWPLMTKADGQKFGKTEEGNVWLDPARTGPYAFHQFWFNVADADVRGLLLKFTLRPVAEIDELMARHAAQPSARLAQRTLADDVTTWVHGADATASVNRASSALFTAELGAEDVAMLDGAIPTLHLTRDELAATSLDQLVHRVGLSSSVSEARRLRQSGGISVDGQRVGDENGIDSPVNDWILLGRGRRYHGLVRLEG